MNDASAQAVVASDGEQRTKHGGGRGSPTMTSGEEKVRNRNLLLPRSSTTLSETQRRQLHKLQRQARITGTARALTSEASCSGVDGGRWNERARVSKVFSRLAARERFGLGAAAAGGFEGGWGAGRSRRNAGRQTEEAPHRDLGVRAPVHWERETNTVHARRPRWASLGAAGLRTKGQGNGPRC